MQKLSHEIGWFINDAPLNIFASSRCMTVLSYDHDYSGRAIEPRLESHRMALQFLSPQMTRNADVSNRSWTKVDKQVHNKHDCVLAPLLIFLNLNLRLM